jgi:hypothetical protein
MPRPSPAIDLFTKYPSNQGKDTGGAAATSATRTATDNGFTDGVNGAKVTVNIPPQSGPYAKRAGYAEVLITMSQRRFFSAIFGSGDLSVSVRAVAEGTRSPRNNGVTIGSQYIVYQLSVTGSGNFLVDYTPLAVPPNRNLYLVE